MPSRDDKLDTILARVNEMRVNLEVHLAKDEDMWRRVVESEDDLKALTKQVGKTSAKQKAILSTLSAMIGAGATVVTRLILP